MSIHRLKVLPLLLVVLAGALAGCGQTGDLYLPDKVPPAADDEARDRPG